jgi:sarcosine oxidase subunit gamma
MGSDCVSKITPTLPLNSFARDWPGFAIKEHYMGEIVSLACVLGGEKNFATQFKKALGKAPPKPNHMVEIEGGFAMWSGQGQYMLLLSDENIQADTDIAAKLKGTAYSTLQSDGWASLDIKGPRAFDVLERFIPLDIRRAPDNFAARTSAHHIAVIVLKFSETEIQLLTPRSSAQSFLEGLVQTVKNVMNT